jgi:hypothetical protein
LALVGAAVFVAWLAATLRVPRVFVAVLTQVNRTCTIENCWFATALTAILLYGSLLEAFRFGAFLLALARLSLFLLVFIPIRAELPSDDQLLLPGWVRFVIVACSTRWKAQGWVRLLEELPLVIAQSGRQFFAFG